MISNIILYSDVNSVSPTVTDKKFNEDAVHRSVENILFTNFHEMPFLRSFGCDLDDLLFEPIDSQTSLEIYHQIITHIDTWEKRVRINNSQSYVKPDYENNSYDCFIAYSIIGLEDKIYSIRGSLGSRRTTILDR